MKPVAQSTIDFYGPYYPHLSEATALVYDALIHLSSQESQIISHIYHRIKTAESMGAKLERRNMPVTPYHGATQLTDAVGFRIICGFLDDVYLLAKYIKSQNDCWQVRECKDYILNVKPNGYRSYHIILDVPTSEGVVIPVELQIRTISQDAWASLEHQMKYKKEIPQKRLIEEELKRCADEMASADITMQTIRDLLGDAR